MRIVQFVESLELGGLEVMAAGLALAQSRAGHSVSVCCLHGTGPLAARLEAAGIGVSALHKRPGLSLRAVRGLAALLRRDRADVIHGHNPGVHHYAAVAARLAGVPVCVNTRHSALTSTGVPYQERYFRWVERLTSHVVFDCDYVRRILEPRLHYPPSKYSVVYNGISLEPFLARPASPGSCLPRLRFGTIGRLVPAKDHATLIDAFAIVASRLPQAELHIFGYGPLEDDLARRISSRGLAGRAVLEGRTADPAAALASLDVFVLSSRNEGLPLVILEAMAAGLPVVSTNVGGIPEIVAPESSWLCPPGDDGAFAEAMVSAAGRSLQALGEQARELARRRYSVEAMAAAYERIYRTPVHG